MRRQARGQAADKAGQTRDLLARHGIECRTITGAGTFEFEAASGVYTELQCGSYIFMDAHYGRNLDRDGDEPPDRGPRDAANVRLAALGGDDLAILRPARQAG